MNNRHDRDQLWNDLLADAAPADLREQMLRQTVGVVRKKRRRRTATLVVGLVIPIALLLTFHAPNQPAVDQPTAVAASTPKALPSQAKLASKISLKPEIISDEELFAMFPNHALALVGSPGNQQLLILGESPARQ